jgi:hypothetical protein
MQRGRHRRAAVVAQRVAAGVQRAADDFQPREGGTRDERAARRKACPGREVQAFEPHGGRVQRRVHRIHGPETQRSREQHHGPLPVGRAHGERMREPH